MNSAEYFIETETMFHRQHEFCQQIAGVLANNGHAQYAVFTRYAEYLDETVPCFVGNSAVEVLEVVARYFADNAALLRLVFR